MKKSASTYIRKDKKPDPNIQKAVNLFGYNYAEDTTPYRYLTKTCNSEDILHLTILQLITIKKLNLFWLLAEWNFKIIFIQSDLYHLESKVLYDITMKTIAINEMKLDIQTKINDIFGFSIYGYEDFYKFLTSHNPNYSEQTNICFTSFDSFIPVHLPNEGTLMSENEKNVIFAEFNNYDLYDSSITGKDMDIVAEKKVNVFNIKQLGEDLYISGYISENEWKSDWQTYYRDMNEICINYIHELKSKCIFLGYQELYQIWKYNAKILDRLIANDVKIYARKEILVEYERVMQLKSNKCEYIETIKDLMDHVRFLNKYKGCRNVNMLFLNEKHSDNNIFSSNVSHIINKLKQNELYQSLTFE